MNNMNVFFTANNIYSGYLATSIASILYNANDDDMLNFFILDSDITDINKKKIDELKKIKDFNIEYIKVDKSLFDCVPESTGKHISKETNYRFLITSLKPDMDKCIFLDADLVVNTSLSELWNVDIEDYYMGCVIDQVGLWEKWNERYSIQPSEYVNTGVILVNMKKWREDNLIPKFFENAQKYAKQFLLPDQDVLNITCASKIKYLDPSWNVYTILDYCNKDDEQIAYANPKILHWANWQKPWLYPDVNMSYEWWKYARMTPFYEEIIY